MSNVSSSLLRRQAGSKLRLAGWSGYSAFPVDTTIFSEVKKANVSLCLVVVLCRNSGSLTTMQSQVQNLRENLGKVMLERDNLKKDQEAKVLDIQEKVKTITQVKKIGRRYKTQYEELKVEYDKVGLLLYD